MRGARSGGKERTGRVGRSEEWQERLERIKSMDWAGVQKRMEELETRLRALEQELKQEEAKQGQNPDE